MAEIMERKEVDEGDPDTNELELHTLENPSSASTKPVFSSNLSDETLLKHFPGTLTYTKDVSAGIRWTDFSPSTPHIKSKPSMNIAYTDVILTNSKILSTFCSETDSANRLLRTGMENRLKAGNFQNLLEHHKIEFGDESVQEIFGEAFQSTKKRLGASGCRDIQRMVSVALQAVMRRLSEAGLIDEAAYTESFGQSDWSAGSVLQKNAMCHTTLMIRYFLKLYCMDKADDGFLSKDDRHEVWKSIITELARYAGVMYSRSGENKRYYYRQRNKPDVIVEADLEIMMSPSLTGYMAASVPRIIVQVCEETAIIPEEEIGQASGQSSSSAARRAHLQQVLPDCITDTASIGKRLFGQHPAQLMTVQQALEHCYPCDPRQPQHNKGKPVIGLFMIDEKVIFTKLTGLEEDRALTVSNWCLHMTRFADRLLLMLFLSTYCEEKVNLSGPFFND